MNAHKFLNCLVWKYNILRVCSELYVANSTTKFAEQLKQLAVCRIRITIRDSPSFPQSNSARYISYHCLSSGTQGQSGPTAATTSLISMTSRFKNKSLFQLYMMDLKYACSLLDVKKLSCVHQPQNTHGARRLLVQLTAKAEARN